MLNNPGITKSKTPLVLIVDDVTENIKVSGGMLAGQGIEIAAATNGEEAIKAARNDSPDLILLDIQMPEMNGIDVCVKLKKDPNTREIPIIFLTAHTEIEQIVKGFKAGAVDYITKPFRAEELIMRVFNHLNLKMAKEEIVKKNAELAEKNKELYRANAAREKFLSIVSQNLKNTFGSTIKATEKALKDIAGIQPQNIESFAARINQSYLSTYELLENLWKWSSSLTGKIEFKPDSVKLNDLIMEVAGNMKKAADVKQISIRFDFEDELLAYADADMVKTIVRNLVSNAIKFTGDGGSIEIAATRRSGALMVSVTDTGGGINKNDLEKLFKIETSFMTRGTRGEEGCGLGLILCREFVEINGGSISAESSPGRGSSFNFNIPEYSRFFSSVK